MADQLHQDFRAQVDATVEALTSAYPRVSFEGVELFRKPGDRSLGYAGGGKIYLNALWFAQPRAAFDAQVMGARSSTPPGYPPWHGRIGGFDHEVERLVTHEFGHLLADTLGDYKEFASVGHSAALADPTMAVSGYALADQDEWFADTFAALRLGGAGSPQVAELEAFLTRNERLEAPDEVDEIAHRADADPRRFDQDALDRCIEVVEQFIPVQEYSGQYQEICSKLMIADDTMRKILKDGR